MLIFFTNILQNSSWQHVATPKLPSSVRQLVLHNLSCGCLDEWAEKKKKGQVASQNILDKRRSLFGSCGACSENIICKLFKNIKCIWENSHFQSWVSFFWKGWFNRTKWKMIQLFINWFLSRCFGNNLLLLPDPFIQTTSVLRKCSH